jgi:hypothetical protein
MQWNKRTIWTCALAGTALYFSVALALKYSYVPPAVPPGEKIALRRPFFKVEKFAFVAATPELSASADSLSDNGRSHVLLYEDDRLLGPAHTSPHAEIAELGRGRFSHWDEMIVFSASDNSDANSNGRKYWAVLPNN